MKKCMAHRGWSGRAPENTMAAIQLAINDPHVNGIEIDVQLTKDGVPILMHDFTLDRTTNGTGFVGSYTYEELLQLDAGSWFSLDYADEKIPTLENVLIAVKGKCLLNIEIKTAGNMHPEIELQMVNLIRQFEMENNVIITSFEHEILRKVKILAPSIKTGLIIWGKPVILEQQLQETGAEILSMAYPYLTKEFVTEYTDKGYRFYAWTVDELQGLQHVKELGSNIEIITNYPDRLPLIYR